MEKFVKKLITILLSLSMLMTFTPTVAFAADLGSYEVQDVTEEVTDPSVDLREGSETEEPASDLKETEEPGVTDAEPEPAADVTEPETVPEAQAEEPAPAAPAKNPEAVTIPDNAKFMVLVSSTPKYHSLDEAGYVTGTVYDTYKGEIVIHDGYVHRSNMKVQVWMQNVASLGITSVRSYVRNIATGMDATNDNPVSQITGLFNSFDRATVIGHAEGKTVNYFIVKNGNVITAEPDTYDNANAVWHAIVNDANVESGLDNNEDSSALITAGSYIQVEDMILIANSDIDVDNLDNMTALSAAIRGAVEYKAAGSTIDGVKVHLAHGTELNLGTTYAKVKKECMTVAMPDLAVSGDMKTALSNLQLAQDTDAMVNAAAEFAAAFLTKMNNSTTNVYFSFDHNYGDAEYKWSEDHSECTAARTCVDCGFVDAETVTAAATESANTFPFEGIVTTYVATFSHAGLEPQTYVDPGTYKDFKFAIEVSSKDSTGHAGSVTGIVYPDYQGVLTIGEGNVNQNNMTVGVWMKDVASLNVEGLRHYERTLNTGMASQDHSLNYVENMFSSLEEATVIARVEGGHAVTYTIVNNGRVITATPGREDNARTVWHEIFNDQHVEAGTKTEDNSSATIAAGSYLQVEDMILVADSDVVVDDLDDLTSLNSAIRGAVTYKEADETIEGVKLYLAKGTVLNMSTSYAKVTEDCLTVTADVAAADDLKTALSELQAAENTNDMMLAVLKGITGFADSINETSTTVTFAFGHDMEEHAAKDPTCTEAGNPAYYECERCGRLFSDAAGTNEIAEVADIPATGHAYGAPEYEWADDNSTCTATMVCGNDESHVVTETVSTTSEDADMPFPYNGTVKTYTATFTKEGFAAQTKNVTADGRDYKFAVSVSSEATDHTVGSVTGIVYDDYQGVFTIGEGLVSQDNMTVGVWMKNVASLGVDGERSYIRTINTGLAPANHSLDTVANMFNDFHEATVIAKVRDGHTVTYTITRDGRVITATPASENNARSVWHEIVNDENITAGTDDDEDSSAHIAAGSYIQIEDMILLAEKDVEIDNLDQTENLIAAIKDAAVYEAVDEEDKIDGVKIHVAQGTKLDLGQSTAEWTRDCMSITVDMEATAEMKAALSKFQSANDVNSMLLAAYESAGTFLEAMDDTTTTAVFSFGHDLTKVDAVPHTCTADGTIEYYVCENCGKMFSDDKGQTEITDIVDPAQGHDWGEPEYTWSQDHAACHAKRVCKNDPSHVEEEDARVTAETSAQGFPFNGEVTTYTPTFTNPAFHADPYIDTRESQDFKFAVSVSSKASNNTAGAVTGIVYPNYQGVLTIGEGLVGRDNMTFDVWMKNVASLNVDGVRHYQRVFSTGIDPQDSSLDTLDNLFSDFKGATVITYVEGGHSATYTITKDGGVFTATPASEDNARAVWHEIVNEQNIQAGTSGDEDSSALIKAGTYIQAEDMILLFEKDLKIDDLDEAEALSEAIRDAVVYKAADEPIDGVKAYVAQGTRLDMGTSYAEWQRNCMSVTIDSPATATLKNSLLGVQNATDGGEMLTAIFGGVIGFIDSINDTTTTVTFDFGHDLTKHEAKAATCEEAGNTEYYECENCGKLFRDAEGAEETTLEETAIEELGHDWNVTYTWSEDNAQVVAVAICGNNPAHIVVETSNTTNVPTAATCDADGKIVYTAEFQNTKVEDLFKTQTKEVKIDKLGHDWGEATYTWTEDNNTVTASATCRRDANHKAEETVNTTATVVTAPTCLTEGVTTYTAEFTKEPFVTQNKTLTVAAKGHSWGEVTYAWSADYKTCTATRICNNDPAHIESETVNSTANVVPENFPLDGYTTTYTAEFSNPDFADQTSGPIPTASHDYKFAVSVSSGASDNTVGSVTGIVYPNYQGVLSINGEKVNSGNVTVGFWMKNVESLGVDGERSYVRSLTTGMAANDYPLSMVEALFSELHEATVIAKVEGKHSVTYTVVNEGKKITATPASENNARSVWHEIVNTDNIDYGTDTSDDSSALIKAGSYIQIEDMILLAEKDVTVDDLDKLDELNAAVRDAVVYKTADKSIEGVKIYVAQGTRIDMGTSYASWKQNCMSVTADVAATQEMKDALQALKNSTDTNGMLKAVFAGISEFCGAIDDTTTTVVFSFGHDLTKVDAAAHTCTEDGNIEYYVCENCGKLFSDAAGETEITDIIDPSEGHDWVVQEYVWAEDNSTVTATAICKNDSTHVITETVNTTPEETEATCETAGKTVYTAELRNTEVAGLFETQTKEVDIPAIGHDWGEPTYIWAEDYSTCTATRVCKRDAGHIETKTVETTTETVDPTATENGKTTYTADFDEPFEDQIHEVVLPATGYHYDEPTYEWSADNSTVTGTAVCREDTDQNVVETVNTTMTWKDGKEANCTEGGTQIFVSSAFASELFTVQTREVEVPALGHDLVKHDAKDPTCTAEGNIEYYECSRCGLLFSDAEGTTQIEAAATAVDATGHKWGITYTWAENKDKVVGVAICENDPTHIAVDYAVPTSKVTTAATCDEAGVTTFTAVFTKEPFTVQTATEPIEATGHDWGTATYTWTEDHKCIAEAVCRNDATHVQAENATVTEAITTAATCEGEGIRTYTATFTKEPFVTQTSTESVASPGHDWNAPTYTWSSDFTTCTAERVCKRDASHIETQTVTSVPNTVYDDFPYDGFTTTYTATFTNPAFETQTKTTETESRDYKFAFEIASTAQNGTEGSVTGIVYPDYQGVLSINGDYVSKDNVTVGFWMKNVASLGVDGVRHYERSLNTGMEASNSSLNVVEMLFAGLHEATVIGKVEGGHSVTYTITNEGRVITADPASENNARSVWHEIVNDENIDYGTKADEDSSAIIKAGSYIQIEDKILLAEKDVTVDNLNDLEALEAGIRDAVVYKTADKTIEGVKVYIAEGTILNMGNSYASWKQNCMSITADVAATQEMKDALQGLKDATDVNGMMTAIFTGISEFCGAIDDTATTVVFSFGHKLTAHEAVAATCEDTGMIAYWECENCGKLFSDEAAETEITEDDLETEALGHLWGEPTYTWSEDFSTCTATRVCERDANHVETKTVETTAVTVDPTATENGKTTYTADFDEPFEDQTHEVVLPATGHEWGDPTYTWSEDNGTVTATLPCTDDPTLTVTETVETTWEWVEGKEATCAEPGEKIYTAHFGNTRFEDQTKTVAVEALGHDWGEPTYAWATDHSACTATSVCKRDESHILTENATITSEVTKAATCETAGEKTYTATFANTAVEGLFETQTATEAIPATGHDWGTPVYTWSENLDKVVAVVICSNNPGHIIIETATVTSAVTDPACETAGATVYTAVFENEQFETQTKTVEIPATGHDWGEATYEWSADKTTCTATAVCKNDATHILTENGKITSEDTTPATCEEDGLRTYTATFENECFETQTTTAVIAALGHDWDTENIVFTWSDDHTTCTATFTCKRDETHKMTLDCEVTSETVGNETTYTATVTFEGEEFTDEAVVDGVLRIYGKNRYKTALKVADYYKEIEKLDKFQAVVIATGANFPDALTGADLAIRRHAPLIMIDKSSAAEVTAYVKANLDPNGKVYVLGGQGAVEDAWVSDLMTYDFTRLDGTDRFETNLSILRELEVKSGDLFICTGMQFADALSSSAIDMPILIVGGKLTENQKTFLNAGSNWNFHLVGGEGAVSAEMEAELADYGTVVDRTGGKNRYETSTALAKKFVPSATQAVLAVGDNYPDGLCGGPVAYLMDAPIILSGTRGAMCGEGIKYAAEQHIYAGIVLGGPSDVMINDPTVRLTFSMGEEDEVIVYRPE